jgi:diguanylate cyclase (GGDEF)-like protein
MIKDSFRILIVDDEKINLKALAELLKDEYVLALAKSGEEGLRRAREDPQPDLILLDVIMPGLDGYQVIRELKHQEQTNHIPVIFVTALNAQEEEEKGLKLGAVDYISKPFSPPIVKMRVRNYLQLVHKYKLLEQKAKLDGLTEIPNRGSFEESFQKEWQRALRSKSPLSVAMLDIDFFKQYNDNYGHQLGDVALQKVASTLRSVLKRPADLVARYGGEEFVLLLPETPSAAALNLAEQIRCAVHELYIAHAYSGIAQNLTVSVGVASMPGETEQSAEELLTRADQNLYQAKQQGRNQVVGD